MKNLFLVGLLTVTVTASAFAKVDPNSVNNAAATEFRLEFKKASDVTWTTTDKFIRASFIFHGEKMEAYYHPNGEKIGTFRSTNLDDLPIQAKRTFVRKFNGYTVKEVMEFNGAEESAYFLSAENEKEVVILKVTYSNQLSVYKRTKK